jgi:hypothetical protein
MLQEEKRLLNERVMELEASLKELKARLDSAKYRDQEELRTLRAHLQARIQDLEDRASE